MRKLPVWLGPVSSVFVAVIPINPIPVFINELYWIEDAFIGNMIRRGYVMSIRRFVWEEPNCCSSDFVREIVFLSHWCSCEISLEAVLI